MIFAFLKFILFLFLICFVIYYDGSASFNIAGRSVDMHIAVIVVICGVIHYLYIRVKSVFKSIFCIFYGKSLHEKGLDNLQKAFSCLLLKDIPGAMKFIEKSKKYLGDIPLISWLEGQLSILRE